MSVSNDSGSSISGSVDVSLCRSTVAMQDDSLSDLVIDLCDGGLCRNLGSSKVLVVNFWCRFSFKVKKKCQIFYSISICFVRP